MLCRSDPSQSRYCLGALTPSPQLRLRHPAPEALLAPADPSGAARPAGNPVDGFPHGIQARRKRQDRSRRYLQHRPLEPQVVKDGACPSWSRRRWRSARLRPGRSPLVETSRRRATPLETVSVQSGQVIAVDRSASGFNWRAAGRPRVWSSGFQWSASPPAKPVP